MATKAMSGDSRFQLQTTQALVSQNIGANTSVVRGITKLVKVGSSTKYASSPYNSYWSASVAGHADNDNQFDYDFRSATSMTLDDREYTISHDSDGNAHWVHSASVDAYDMGSASVSTTVTVKRIPQLPDAPGAPVMTSVTTTSMTATSTAPDNGGATITEYTLQASIDNFATVSNEFTSTTRVVNATGLIPGAPYTWRMFATNSRGDGPASALTTQATLPALYVSDGTTWQPAALQVSDGNNWNPGQLTYSDGTQWLNPLPQ